MYSTRMIASSDVTIKNIFLAILASVSLTIISFSSIGQKPLLSPSPQCLAKYKKTENPGSTFDYFLPFGYRTNEVKYFNDFASDNVIYQPVVYNSVAHLANLTTSNNWVIDVGCGTGVKAARIYDNSALNFVEIDFGNNLAVSRQMFKETRRFKKTNGNGAMWREWDASKELFPRLEGRLLKGSTVVASDIIEHLENPDDFIDSLIALLHGCGVHHLIISSYNRMIGNGPPHNTYHVREWTMRELAAYLVSRGAPVQECVLTNSIAGYNRIETSTCLISKTLKTFPDRSNVVDFFIVESQNK